MLRNKLPMTALKLCVQGNADKGSCPHQFCKDVARCACISCVSRSTLLVIYHAIARAKAIKDCVNFSGSQ